MTDVTKLRQLFGRLKGIREIVGIQAYTSKEVGDDYNLIVDSISKIIDENLISFKLTGDFYYTTYGGKLTCSSDTIRNKLLQFLAYLEYGYSLSEQVIEIGSIYNSIIDEELKSRCSDILSAPSNFDRVVNQSTQVLEDRIRTKSKADKTLVGVGLINKTLNTDLSKTILIISSDKEEHEGICHICRGLMMSFRNPTHHYLSSNYSREQALKFCAFIDNILQLIDNAKINKDNS
jgi:hypothetical protein